MSRIGEFYLIPPDQWLFETHGDVLESKLRAQLWFEQNATYQGAEFEIEEFVRQWALKLETGRGTPGAQQARSGATQDNRASESNPNTPRHGITRGRYQRRVGLSRRKAARSYAAPSLWRCCIR